MKGVSQAGRSLKRKTQKRRKKSSKARRASGAGEQDGTGRAGTLADIVVERLLRGRNIQRSSQLQVKKNLTMNIDHQLNREKKELKKSDRMGMVL